MAEIEIQRINRAMVSVAIEGTAPLICNRFSEKAKQQMLDKQQGKTSLREPKNPEANFQASLYPLPGDRYGLPAVMFKAATVGAARYFDSKVTMTSLKQIIFIQGEGSDMLVPIDGTPKMREDNVRNESGVADIRHRGEFWPWAAQLDVIYVPSVISLSSVIALVDAGGMGGVGEWRPASKKSNTGMYGTYRVLDDQETKEILL